MTTDLFWQDAACRTLTPSLFFGAEPRRPDEDTTDYTHAVAVCARCPVIEDCRQWAEAHGERDGVYGGLTPHQRHLMRQARRRLARR